MPLPERHHESVTLLPLQVTFANSGPPLAANDMVDRRAGVAMRFSGLFAFEKLHLAGHRRIGVAAGDGIDITQQPPVIRIAVAVAHRSKRRVSVLPSITKRYAARMAVLCFHRARKAHSAKRLASLARDRLFRKFRVFEEENIERLDQRPVQAVQPDNRVLRLVVMVVPGPVGRENQVALFHEKFLAIDRRISAPALHDKSDRRHIVPVRPRHFARIDDGKSHLQGMRG